MNMTMKLILIAFFAMAQATTWRRPADDTHISKYYLLIFWLSLTLLKNVTSLIQHEFFTNIISWKSSCKVGRTSFSPFGFPSRKTVKGTKTSQELHLCYEFAIDRRTNFCLRQKGTLCKGQKDILCKGQKDTLCKGQKDTLCKGQKDTLKTSSKNFFGHKNFF